MKHREVLQKLNDLFPDKTYCGADFTSTRFPVNKQGVFDVQYQVWVHFYKDGQDELDEVNTDEVTRIDSKRGCQSWDEAWESFKQNYTEHKTQMAKLEVTE